MLDYNTLYDWLHTFKEKGYCKKRDIRNRRCNVCGPCRDRNKEYVAIQRDLNSTSSSIAKEDYNKSFNDLDDRTKRKVLVEAGGHAIRRFQQRMEKLIAERQARANAPSFIEMIYEVYTEGLQHEAHRAILREFDRK